MSSADPLQILAWLVDAGAAEAVGETPVDRLAAQPERTPAAGGPFEAGATGSRRMPAATGPGPGPSRSAPRTPPESTAEPDADLIGAAQKLARSAATLDDLKAAVEGFDGCALKKTANRMVFSGGNPKARIMLIGEAPGRDEDRTGIPFVGRAGKLLDKMLAAIRLDRERVYITNVLNWRPPANRDPTPDEAGTMLPFLRRHIELVDPAVIILLGAVSTHHVMGIRDSILRLRGRWLEYRLGDRMVPALPTLHPAYLLRQPGHKKLAWRDLLTLEEKLLSLRLLETQTGVG